MPAHHGKYVAYYHGGRLQLVAEFVEVESGKRASRPQLDAAIAACKKQKAKLISERTKAALKAAKARA